MPETSGVLEDVLYAFSPSSPAVLPLPLESPGSGLLISELPSGGVIASGDSYKLLSPGTKLSITGVNISNGSDLLFNLAALSPESDVTSLDSGSLRPFGLELGGLLPEFIISGIPASTFGRSPAATNSGSLAPPFGLPSGGVITVNDSFKPASILESELRLREVNVSNGSDTPPFDSEPL